jgi:hypothetical protein
MKGFVVILGKKNRAVLGSQAGFALPMAIALGTAMLALASLSLLVAQGDRNKSFQRQASGASVLVSDSALARVLLQLSKPNNSELLVRNYDSINPTTGKTYLGADGIPKSGDETGTAVDEWTGYNPNGSPCAQQRGRAAPNISLTGIVGTNGTYTIRAYRYDKQKKIGTLVAEGVYQNNISLVAVTLTIEPILDDFPGVFLKNNGGSVDGKIALRNRSIFGKNGNVYYAPSGSADASLTGVSAPGDATRPSYLNAIWAGSSDGASSDAVEGKLFACRLTPTVPVTPQGTSLTINTSQTLLGSSSGITHYQIQLIDLDDDQTLTVNTTAGPVYLYLKGGSNSLVLRENAKIINTRTDGQSPQVGDLRIMSLGDDGIHLYDTTCIQDAFIYIPKDQLELYTTGAGCPSGQNTNFEGVAWVEELLFSKNAASNRDVVLSWQTIQNTTVIPNATAGIDVPDDVSSLADLLEYVNWPVRYRYKIIQSWQRVH